MTAEVKQSRPLRKRKRKSRKATHSIGLRTLKGKKKSIDTAKSH